MLPPKRTHAEPGCDAAPAVLPLPPQAERPPARPAVSVVIPCYQQAQYLPEAVASVVAQTFPDWEILIVNDGSPDETSSVARELIGKHPGRRIRLIEQANGGLAHARNTGIRAAAGAYILPLDADDLLEPCFLEQAVPVLEHEPAVAIVYTDVLHFGSADKVVRAAEYDFQELCLNNRLSYCSLFRREAWEQVGGYNRNMIWGYEDWDFWIGCGEQGFVGKRLPGAYLRYRVKDASMYSNALAHDQQLRARIVLNHPALYPPAKHAEARSAWSDRTLPQPPGAPKVSVVVPTHNRPERLLETLRSILSQTLQDFEILVVNDAGVEVGPALEQLNAGDKIRYLRHAKNAGLAAARNTALRFACGKYIAYLDDDDIYLPDHLQTLVDFLESTGNAAAYTDAWCGREALVEGRYQVLKREVLYSLDWDNDRILYRNFVPVLCFMHERACGIAAGEFDESLGTQEDWDFWIRLSRVCRPVHLRKVTCEFRLRQDDSSMSIRRRTDFLRTARVIFRKYRAYAAGKPEVRRQQRQFLLDLQASLKGAPARKRESKAGPLLLLHLCKRLWRACFS